MPVIVSKPWWYHDYEIEIHRHMLWQEKGRVKLRFSSPQLHLRQCLIQWLIAVATVLELGRKSVHLSFYILDVFMERHTISDDSLHLVTLTSLFLAGKFEEQSSADLNTGLLSIILGEDISLRDFRRLEFLMMKTLNWRFIPTTAHFADYYSCYAITYDDLLYTKESNYELQLRLRNIIFKFVDEIPYDNEYMRFQSSVLASACIAAARAHLGLYPRWTERLNITTGYRYHHIFLCTNMLLRSNIAQPRVYSR